MLSRGKGDKSLIAYLPTDSLLSAPHRTTHPQAKIFNMFHGSLHRFIGKVPFLGSQQIVKPISCLNQHEIVIVNIMSGYDSSQEQGNMMFLSVKYWQAHGGNATLHHHWPCDNSTNQLWQPLLINQIENFSFPEVSLRSQSSLRLFEILRAFL